MDTLTRRHMLSLGVAGGTSLALTGLGSTSSGSLQAKAESLSSQQASPLKLQIVIFDGFELIDALAPFDVLTLASSHLGAQLNTTLVTVDGSMEVVSLKGVSVKPTSRFDPSADLLLVPGCGGQWPTLRPQGLSETLLQWHSAGKTITADCVGTMLVAQTGLLKGRNATTHHLAFDALQQAGANVINARVVDDGDIITAGGVTSGLDLALYLIERYCNPQIAIAAEQAFEFERRGVTWRTSS